MAFHVACPITCRKICFCELGFPRNLQTDKGRNGFLDEIFRIEDFVKDPWLLKAEVNATVQVKVPKVAVVAPPSLPSLAQPLQPVAAEVGGDGNGDAEGDEAALVVSAQTKRVALQKKAAAASLVAEDFVRRFESGEAVAVKDDPGEENAQSKVKVMCRLCFGGENEGSETARKMLPCNTCGKKYHRSCLKSWSKNRDLFHWSSWTCPSCRVCEVCKRMGDPSKFMFCKRCDGAHHCYCQQPPHKNVSSGPYLCPKHTKCHSCASTVPGNGLSVRWFLGYTCCDACGRLFVKGNYCPVCLKVYRDSEATPMVCCDVCQRWVHCQCDGISDAKYLQFQVDGNLQYSCPTCRGECYQVRNLEDAVQELWKRRDEADRDLIVSLRAAAGLPTQEEIFSISPFSDDEENDLVVLKNETNRSLKFSVKGLVDKSPKKNKDGKKSSSKKSVKKELQSALGSRAEANQSIERLDTLSFDYNSVDSRKHSSKNEERGSFLSPIAGSLTEGMCSTNQAGVQKHKFIDEVNASNGNRAPRTVKIKTSNFQGGLISGDGIGDQNDSSKTSKGRRLVIHIGSRNKNAAISPSSDASSCQKDIDMSASNGSEDVEPRLKELMDRQDNKSKFGTVKAAVVSDQNKDSKPRGKEGSLIKFRNSGAEATDMSPKFFGGKFSDTFDTVSSRNTRSLLGKRGMDTNTTAGSASTEVSVGRGNKWSPMMSTQGRPIPSVDTSQTPVSPKETKPLLKLKLKNPVVENQSSWTPKEEERISVKGQRSKRKRPSPIRERVSSAFEDDARPSYKDNTMDEFMDASWILQKLGKDAIGKRVEVQQASNNTWNKGTVTEVFEGSSRIFVALDNGKTKNLELGRQGVRFISQKQKR